MTVMRSSSPPFCFGEKLLNVLPTFAGDNFLDKRDGNAETVGNVGVPDMLTCRLSDLRDFGLIQLGACIGRAILPSLPILLVAIIHIVLVCAKKEMRWIATQPAVTSMAYLHVVWDWAKMNLPRNALGVCGYAVDYQHPIAIRAKPGCPVPTIIRATNIDLLPKSIFNGPWGLEFACMSVQESHRLPFDASPRAICITSKVGWLAAATFAEFGGGLLRGMIIHVDTFLSRFGHSGGRLQRRSGSFIEVLQTYFSTFGRNLEVAAGDLK
jgi:hypothetical protein